MLGCPRTFFSQHAPLQGRPQRPFRKCCTCPLRRNCHARVGGFTAAYVVACVGARGGRGGGAGGGGGGGRGTDIGPGETSEAQQRLAISHVQISILGRHGEIIPKRVPGFCETGFFVYYTILARAGARSRKSSFHIRDNEQTVKNPAT